MLDLSDDDPQWRYIASMNTRHLNGVAVVIEKKIYVLGGFGDTSVEVYDVEQGKYIDAIFAKYYILDVGKLFDLTHQSSTQRQV